MGGNTQELDAVVGGKFPDDLESASIFNKVIGHKLSYGPSDDIYLRCRMNFVGDAVQTYTPQLVYLGLPTINTLNESSVLGNTATRIISPTYVPHWSVPDHVFGEATAVVMSAAKSYHDYNYKT